MSDATRILNAIDQGDPQAAERLLPLVYDALRKLAAQRLAQEKPGQTLDATALVHEAYVRLVDSEDAQRWNSRGHFFAAAAESMRRILIERARSKAREKRGGDWRRVDRGQARQSALLCRPAARSGRNGSEYFPGNSLSALGVRARVALQRAANSPLKNSSSTYIFPEKTCLGTSH